MHISFKTHFIVVLLLFSCRNDGRHFNNSNLKSNEFEKIGLVNIKGSSIKTRFNPPKSYTRVTTDENSFAHYLQSFPLKPHNSKVHLFNGELKYIQSIHSAVLDIDVGNRDLQQCADAIMRLRSEFLYEQRQFDKISFNFTNGFKADYSKWRDGYRIKVGRKKVSWLKTTTSKNSYETFRHYLMMVFNYAGTLSLEKELLAVELGKLQIGDIFIQGGSPGHAIIVVDVATDKNGEKIFLLAQSYMPAQEIHILKNLNITSMSPWYSATNLESLITPEWTFTKNDLKRFH